ncbi:MAG: phosphoglycerate mutase family protein [Candidatus Shapirobacteria bacterium]|nr:phosphoglycerate mutase family protein [Candidatus Shapirobacteria bacterium]
MKIFLIRHGEKQKSNSVEHLIHKKLFLTAQGRKQIKLLANFLRKEYPQLKNLKTIYSSPILRASETSEILKEILNIKTIKFLKLIEEFDIDKKYYISKEIYFKFKEKALINRDFDPLIKNILDFFHQKFLDHDQNLLISTHGALIRNTIYYLFPQMRPSSDKILESAIYNGGLTILDYNGKDFKLDKFDFADYLGDLSTK